MTTVVPSAGDPTMLLFEVPSTQIVRRIEEPWTTTAQQVVAALVDSFSASGGSISSRIKGQIARHAKTLLADGFEPTVVFAAAVCAVERVAPNKMPEIAQDIENVRIGRYQPRDSYRQRVVEAANRLRIPEHEREALYGSL